MKKAVKTVAIVILLSMIFSLYACEESSSTGICELSIATLNGKEFYSGTTYDGLKVNVENTLEYETGDVNVVIADNSIIDITFEKKETLFSNYISYNIKCKSTGATTFYFETSDKVVKSEEVKIEVLSNIKSISFINNSDLTLYDWQYDEERSFEIESHKSVSNPQDILEFISENPKVATIEYDENSWISNRCKIKRVGAGETYIYIRAKDKTVQSEKIKVIVKAEEPEEEEETVVDTPVDTAKLFILPLLAKNIITVNHVRVGTQLKLQKIRQKSVIILVKNVHHKSLHKLKITYTKLNSLLVTKNVVKTNAVSNAHGVIFIF